VPGRPVGRPPRKTMPREIVREFKLLLTSYLSLRPHGRFGFERRIDVRDFEDGALSDVQT
jgi:hypothetical protein